MKKTVEFFGDPVKSSKFPHEHQLPFFWKRLISFFLICKNLLTLIWSALFLNVFCIIEKMISGVFKKNGRSVWTKKLDFLIAKSTNFQSLFFTVQRKNFQRISKIISSQSQGYLPKNILWFSLWMKKLVEESRSGFSLF